MLIFYPASFLHPWDYLFQNLVNEIPTGTMYTQGFPLLPRSDKKTEFILQTDHFIDTAISINNKLITVFRPNAALQRVSLPLYDPPISNLIRVENGIDEPVSLLINTSHQASFYEVFGRELYEYLYYTIEKTYREMTSPWATFFIDYQLPWRDLLPDLQELRIMSVRMAANSLFGEFGFDGAEKDLISSFTFCTPAILPAKNPPIFMPDLFNPVSSGDDATGFIAHVWFLNVCVNRRIAFQKLINNLDPFIAKNVSEEALIYQRAGTDIFRQHLFSDSGQLCSVSNLINFLGCMDRMTAVLETSLVSNVSVSMYMHSSDQVVLPPGIGGKFWDSGKTLDGEFGPFDSTYDIDLLTDFWVGAPITHFDTGCMVSSQRSLIPQNTDPCTEGPPTTTLDTTVSSAETTSAVTPASPLFGGGDPGLLLNPYFSIPHG